MNDKIYCIIVSLLLIFIAGFRSKYVGTDTQSYVSSFLNSPPMNSFSLKEVWSENERLFYIFNMVSRSVTDKYYFWLFTTSVIYITSISFLIYYFSKYKELSYLIFISMQYYFFSMAAIKQTLAASLIIISIIFVFKNKKFLALFIILLSTQFHLVGIFALPLVLIDKFKVNKVTIMLTGILMGLISSYGVLLILFIKDILWKDKGYYSDEYGGVKFLILLIIIFLCAYIVFVRSVKDSRKTTAFKSKKLDLNKLNEMLLAMVLMSIPLQMFAIFQANAFRVAALYHISSILLIPNTLICIHNRSIRNISYVTIIFLLLIQFYIFTYNIADIIPYTFFWDVY